ncbi:sugar phosphate isomerase/epimerase family protein [Sphingomonas sp. LHG3443-2]|uniref:sugar phosphate isomerase/epimerase family protein n=1 Tax=Sphingomonas sp. LHG3443-2 TaxID=2804639 RepID=UPI003CF363FA
MVEGFAASNIAWPNDALDEALGLLPQLGFSGVEIAPRNIFDSWDMDAQEVRALRQRLGDAGLTCPSLQGILFDVPGATLFGSKESRTHLHDHLSKVARLAGLIGARACVFGAPRQRDVGTLTQAEATAIAIDFFSALAPVFEEHGTAIAFEANAAHYGCNFVTTTRQAIDLVRAIDRPGVRLQIDTGTILLEGEDPRVLVEAAPLSVHAHVSEPDLRPIGQGNCDHARLAPSLKASGYRGFVSVEMRCTPDWAANLGRAAAVLQEHYA